MISWMKGTEERLLNVIRFWILNTGRVMRVVWGLQSNDKDMRETAKRVFLVLTFGFSKLLEGFSLLLKEHEGERRTVTDESQKALVALLFDYVTHEETCQGNKT